jgi:ribulose-5-phosphate 4-epimerase/fuculose-1-phosphate aldolase
MTIGRLQIPSMREQVSPEEWQTRVDLAACYRLIADFGMSDLVFNHVTARVPGTKGEFLINPYGLMFEEITASSLVRVDAAGTVLQDTPFFINPAGYVIHSAVHGARHDVECVIHTHSANGVAVAAQEDGLLPLSQQATFVLPSLGYHDYEGVALRDDEKARLVADLANNTFLILRNHGLLTVGTTIADAFLWLYTLECACEIQVKAQAGGGRLRHIAAPIMETARAFSAAALKGQGGGIAWPALLRKLDRADPSFRD